MARSRRTGRWQTPDRSCNSPSPAAGEWSGRMSAVEANLAAPRSFPFRFSGVQPDRRYPMTSRTRWLCRTAIILFIATLLADAAWAERMLYVVNSGGTIATFAIQSNGALVSSGGTGDVGTFLRGIVIAPDGRSAYVLDSADSTVLAFAIAPDGALAPIGSPLATDPDATAGPFPICLPGQTSGTGPCPWGLALSPDGRTLYVAN